MKESTKKFALDFARSVIENFVSSGKMLAVPKGYPSELDANGGVFVTLNKHGDLRGCIGIPYPVDSVIKNLREAAASVTKDPRFPPLGKGELKEIETEVSVLTEPKIISVKEPSEYLGKIRKDIDGLIIRKGYYEGLFLPQVWEQIPDKVDFLDNLCMKAGLMPGDWKSDGVELYKFQVEKIEDN